MRSDKLNSFLNGAGFYIVLFLTLAVIGASGYFIWSTVSRDRAPQSEPAGQTTLLSEQPEHTVPEAENSERGTEQSAQDDHAAAAAVSGTARINTPAAAAEQPVAARVQPLDGDTVTPFSVEELRYDETMGDWRTHNGVDIAAPEGSCAVAAAAGRVSAVVDDYWMGTTVTVDCGDGYELTYASLRAANVSAGDALSPGDPIGEIGSTTLQEQSLPAHLHFAVTRSGIPVDPAQFLQNT